MHTSMQDMQAPKWLCLLHKHIDMPEQALGWLPLGLGLVVDDEPSEL